jgi:MFS family permease
MMQTMETCPRATESNRRAALLPLALLVCVGAVNYLDRSSLSIAHGPIRQSMHLTETQMGALLSAFSLAYGIAQLPLGPLLDKLGTRRVLGTGIALWSAAQLMVRWVASLSGFIGLRFLLGVGEAPFYPASVKLIRDTVPASSRGRAMAVVNASAMAGQVIAPPLLTALMLWLGWRFMFFASGALGLILAALWFGLLRETSSATSDPATPTVSLHNWLALFRTRFIWCIMLGFGGVNYAAWFYLAWLPAYLEKGHGISIAHTGWLAAVPFVAAAIGMLLSGSLADVQVRRGASAAHVHLRHIIFGMVCSALSTVFVSHADSAIKAVALISSALFFLHFAGNSGWGFAQASSPRHLVATVSGIQNFGSQMIGALAPFLTGWTLDHTHTFAAAFALCAAVTLCGALSYLSLARSPGLRLEETSATL